MGRIEPSMKEIIKHFVQSMDPMTLHNWVGVGLGLCNNHSGRVHSSEAEAGEPKENADGENVDSCKATGMDLYKLLDALHKIDPHAMRAVILDALNDIGNSSDCAPNAASGCPMPRNFLATLLQGLSGEIGCGNDAYAGPSGHDNSG